MNVVDLQPGPGGHIRWWEEEAACGLQGRLPLSCPQWPGVSPQPDCPFACSFCLPPQVPAYPDSAAPCSLRSSSSFPLCGGTPFPSFFFLWKDHRNLMALISLTSLCVLGRHLCLLETLLLGTELLPLLVALHIPSVGTVHLPSRGLERESTLNTGWWVQALLLAEPPPRCWLASAVLCPLLLFHPGALPVQLIALRAVVVPRCQMCWLQALVRRGESV